VPTKDATKAKQFPLSKIKKKDIISVTDDIQIINSVRVSFTLSIIFIVPPKK
jgi:hypothetical protein